jgi:hypothetical protein
MAGAALYRMYGMPREARDGRSGAVPRFGRMAGHTIFNNLECLYMPPSGGWMKAAGAVRNRLFTGKVRLRVSPLSPGPGLSRGVPIIL